MLSRKVWDVNNVLTLQKEDRWAEKLTEQHQWVTVLCGASGIRMAIEAEAPTKAEQFAAVRCCDNVSEEIFYFKLFAIAAKLTNHCCIKWWLREGVQQWVPMILPQSGMQACNTLGRVEPNVIGVKARW